ncbi:MAG: hypothetical protein ACOC56_06315 [Atribacterota bacterium]
MNIKELKKSDIKKIERIIELTYLSSFLKDKLPLSLMLISPPEQSKTYFLLSKTTKKSKVLTDLSWKGVLNILGEKENQNLSHLVIPDLLKLTEKKASTKNNLLSLLNGFLEEGIFEIKVGNDKKIDFEGRSGGMITATTKKSYEQNRKNWEKMGLTSRFLKVSYRLSNGIIHNIMRKISKQKKQKQDPTLIEAKEKSIKVKKEHTEEIINLSNHSIRKFQNLSTLLEAIALDHNREETIDKDLEELKILLKYVNTNFKKIEK